MAPMPFVLLSLLLLSGCLPPDASVLPVRSPLAIRYEGRVDPLRREVSITPVGMSTQATGLFVRHTNAAWNPGTTVFSFDLLATNRSGGSLNTVRGEILSTTPASPTILPTGTNGTGGNGRLYYDYGTLADGATGTATWRFSDPSATPFRFGFTVTRDAGVDTGPVKNKAPSAAVITPGGTTVAAGGSLSLNASATDPDGDTPSYTWSATGGGSVSGTGSSVTFQAPWAGGTFPVSLTVDDGRGGTATAIQPITVSPPNLVSTGLLLDLDAGNPASYAGSGTTWTDLSGNGNHGSLQNGPTYATANGGAVAFDGVNDYVGLGTALNAVVRPNQAATYEAWTYLNANGADNAIIGDSWSSNGVLIRKNSANKIRFLYIATGTDFKGVETAAIATGWHHVVATYTGSGVNATSNYRIYLDGSLPSLTSLSSGSISTISPPNSMNLGRSGDSSGYAHLTGKIAAARVYNWALSATDVQQNYNALKGRFGLP